MVIEAIFKGVGALDYSDILQFVNCLLTHLKINAWLVTITDNVLSIACKLQVVNRKKQGEFSLWGCLHICFNRGLYYPWYIS